MRQHERQQETKERRGFEAGGRRVVKLSRGSGKDPEARDREEDMQRESIRPYPPPHVP